MFAGVDDSRLAARPRARAVRRVDGALCVIVRVYLSVVFYINKCTVKNVTNKKLYQKGPVGQRGKTVRVILIECVLRLCTDNECLSNRKRQKFSATVLCNAILY